MTDLLPQHRRAALALNAAVLNHRVASINSEELVDMGLPEARTIVADNLNRWTQRGFVHHGWAANLIVPSRQEAHGVQEPIIGAVMDSGLIEPDQTIALSRFQAPLIGGGLALRMNMDLPAQDCSSVDVRRCTSAVLATLMIYDSRLDFANNGIALQADNGGFGAGVLAARGKALTKVDVVSTVATLSHDGKEVGTGSGKNLMGDPVNAAAWMCNVIGSMGLHVKEGDTLLVGVCTPLMPLTVGKWTVSIPMVGEVTLNASEGVD